ncbi:MAG: hypothetical protein WDZ53_08225, partial [Balneolales bacterium]
TFNIEGRTVIFTVEWGGGTLAICGDSDPFVWGANAIFTIKDGRMEFQSYFKMDAAQTKEENCVAHNGSLIPIPGRDIMVQSWYQGGINVFDFTDPANPVEIAWHDRGPISGEQRVTGGSWSVYWYNGSLVNSEIARGLDVFELLPSDFVTGNEIAAARTVKMDYLNPQGQPKFKWPPSFALARASLDQLERNGELGADSLTEIRRRLTRAEQARSSRKARQLNELAAEVERLSGRSANTGKMDQLAVTIKELAMGS